MTTFTYRGITAGGGQVSAEISASDARAAARQLRSQGITVQNIVPKRAAGGGRFALSAIPVLGTLPGGVRGKDIAVFCRQFATMITASPPPVQLPATPGQPA